MQRLQPNQQAVSPVNQHDVDKFVNHIKHQDYERLPRRLDDPLLQYAINALNSENETALMWAVHNNDLEALSLLLKGGANPNIKARGLTITMHAVGKPLMLETLLNWKVKEDRADWMWDGNLDLNAVDNEGKTALMHAVNGNYGYTFSVFALVDAGADVSIRDHEGKTASMYATNPAILEKLSRHNTLPAHASHFLNAIERQLKTAKSQDAVNISMATMNKMIQLLQNHAHEDFTLSLKEILFQFSIFAIMVKQDKVAREARRVAAEKLGHEVSLEINNAFHIGLDEEEEEEKDAILPKAFL
ncbi:MAG: ankyrin repeat domain-containing protein [Gammaproteobacteria bacterium]|nr:ankyrin repeat domain-containing protein [Gammaproteobacteria bacterium]